MISKRLSAALILAFVGAPSLGFAVVSGLFNASYAARLGHNGREAAVWVMASVLVTVFLTGLPLAIEVLRVRVPHLATAARGLWIAAMAFSFVSAMGFAAMTRGQKAAETSATIRDREGLERAIARYENEVAALSQHRPTGAIQADIEATQAAIGYNCTPKLRNVHIREACAPVFDLKRELAAANDAERIEARLEQLRETLNGMAVVGTSANPQADVLSWIGGGVLASNTWEKLLTVFIAGLIELSAALGLAIAARAVVEILRDDEVQEQPAPMSIVVEPMPLAEIGPDTGWQMWFQTCVMASKGSRVTTKEAFTHYESWCGLNNVTTLLPYITFGKRMSEAVSGIGGRIGSSNGRYYADVSLAKLGSNGVPVIEQEASE